MRILMLTDSFYPEIGGSETAIWKLGEALIAKGHEVGVAVISKPNASNPSKVLRFWLISPKVGPFNLKFIGRTRNVRRLMREWKPDVVNVHFMLECGYVGVTAARKEGVPSVLTNRGKGLYNEPGGVLDGWLYEFWNRGATRADAYIATSQEMVDRAKERYGLESLAISNGVDTDVFRPGLDGSAVRREHGVKDGQKVIICARRLVPKNGIEYIIRALPAIREKHDAVLWLASPKIREYERLAALANMLGVGEQVVFLGPLDHLKLPVYFNAADLVVQPSIAEARSLACLEAMASGSAIVATATGGLKELITHKENGYLVDEFQTSTYAVDTVHPKGVEDLARGVIEVLGDDALLEKLRRNAREYALTCSWPSIADQTLAIYGKAIAGHRSRRG